MLNGSPRANGNTSVALKEMEQVFKDNGIETEIILVGNKDIRGCIACGSCYEKGKCVFNDMVNELALSLKKPMDLSLQARYIMRQQMRH